MNLSHSLLTFNIFDGCLTQTWELGCLVQVIVCSIVDVWPNTVATEKEISEIPFQETSQRLTAEFFWRSINTVVDSIVSRMS